ncbi:hypothetical protein AB6D11_00450 [Vibrio splendidus]
MTIESPIITSEAGCLYMRTTPLTLCIDALNDDLLTPTSHQDAGMRFYQGVRHHYARFVNSGPYGAFNDFDLDSLESQLSAVKLKPADHKAVYDALLTVADLERSTSTRETADSVVEAAIESWMVATLNAIAPYYVPEAYSAAQKVMEMRETECSKVFGSLAPVTVIYKPNHLDITLPEKAKLTGVDAYQFLDDFGQNLTDALVFARLLAPNVGTEYIKLLGDLCGKRCNTLKYDFMTPYPSLVTGPFSYKLLTLRDNARSPAHRVCLSSSEPEIGLEGVHLEWVPSSKLPTDQELGLMHASYLVSQLQTFHELLHRDYSESISSIKSQKKDVKSTRTPSI